MFVVWGFLLLVCGSSAAGAEFPGAAWKTASPESQGLDSAILAEALDHVRTNRIPAHSFLILRNGVIVLDAYFYPYQGLEIHDIASSTKSVTSVAVGIAIGGGFIRSIDQQVSSLLPHAPAEADRRKERLTVRHLLTMTSGLDCDTEGGEKALAAMRLSANTRHLTILMAERMSRRGKRV